MNIATIFDLSIFTPTQSFHHKVQWIVVESPNGNFFIGPNHSPLVSLLKIESQITYMLENSKEESYSVTSGIIYIKNNQAMALLD